MSPILTTLNNLNPVEKHTFKIHLSYLFVEGIITGVLALNEFIFIKGLKGTSYQLSLLFQFSLALLLLSVFLNEYLKKYKDKEKLLKIVAYSTRLPLLLLLLFPASITELTSNEYYHIIFLAIFFIYYIAQPVVMPVMVQSLKMNYRHENFSKLYSYSTMVNKIVMLFTTFLFGLLLDYYNFSFRFIYAGIGILGVVSINMLRKIKVEQSNNQHLSTGLKNSFLNSWSKSIKIIRHDKAFRDFEIGFMLYGYAWISVTMIVNLFYDRILMLNYSSTAFYKNVYNLLAIVMLPTFGRLLGKVELRKFSIMTYGFMLLMIIFTALTQYFQTGTSMFGLKLFYFLLAGSVAYGFFSATMPLLWDIGSAYHCSTQDTDIYQSVHMSLTGVRGLFAPLIGIWIFEKTGFTVSFAVAALSLLAAIIYIHFSGRKRSFKMSI